MAARIVQDEARRRRVLKGVSMIFLLTFTLWLGFQTNNWWNGRKAEATAGEKDRPSPTPAPAPAPVKEKTVVEQLVPETARDALEQAGETVPQVLDQVKQAGRTNYQLRQLRKDTLILNSTQERQIAAAADALERYLKSVVQAVEKSGKRLEEFQGGDAASFLYDQISAGNYVHPQARKSVDEIQQLRKLEPDSFYDSQRLGTEQHVFHEIRDRLVKEDLRRADLFTLIESYRLGTLDLSHALQLENTLDRMAAMLQLSLWITGNAEDWGEMQPLMSEFHRQQLAEILADGASRVPVALLTPLRRDHQPEQRKQLRGQVEQLIAQLGLPDHKFDLDINLAVHDTYMQQCLIQEELEARAAKMAAKAPATPLEALRDQLHGAAVEPPLARAAWEIVSGEEQFHDGEFAAALARFESAAKRVALSEPRRKYLADLCLLAGQDDRAKTFDPAAGTRPTRDNFLAFLAKAEVLQKAGQLDAADAVLQQSRAVAVKSPETHLALMDLQFEQKKFFEAVASLKRAQQLGKLNDERWNQMLRYLKTQAVIQKNAQPRDLLNSVPMSLANADTYLTEEDRQIGEGAVTARFAANRSYLKRRLMRDFVLDVFR